MPARLNWTIYTQWTLLYNSPTNIWTPAHRQEADGYTEDWQPYKNSFGQVMRFTIRDEAVNFLYTMMRRDNAPLSGPFPPGISYHVED